MEPQLHLLISDGGHITKGELAVYYGDAMRQTR